MDVYIELGINTSGVDSGEWDFIIPFDKLMGYLKRGNTKQKIKDIRKILEVLSKRLDMYEEMANE